MTVKVTTLSNGLRIATDHMDEAESVVIGAWVGVGTRHEPWAANGVAHLVEHMMFKGTKRRSAFALASEIEKNGGMMNAHTTREETAYYARVLPEDAELACDVVADMLQHSVMDKTELDRERKVVIQEIGRDSDTAEDTVFDLMHQKAFPRQRIGRPILGSANVIAKLPRAAIVAYVKKYYHARNMVVVAAGRVDHEKIVDMVKARFGRLPKGSLPRLERAKVGGGDVRVEKAIEQLHLILAFPAPGVRSPDLSAAQLLSIILGGSTSSRLFQKVREKRGLAYTVNAGQLPFNDAGLFEIYAGTDPARVQELVSVLCNELLDVQSRITPVELERAKAQARADILMGQESVMRRAETLGHNMVAYGKPVAIAEILKKLMATSEDDVKAVAKKIFARKPVVAALGPLAGLESYRDFISKLS